MDFKNFDYNNKTILEIGTGRGGTTKIIGELISDLKNTKLITTDIFDGNFEAIKNDLEKYNLNIDFIKTDGTILEGIKNSSIDIIVCNYTLCAINSNAGSEVLALNRFKEVLKPDGILYIEEEYPINIYENINQEIWSRKWELHRSLDYMLGELSFNETNPTILEEILEILGFNNINWEKSNNIIVGEDVLEFFRYRFENNLKDIDNEELYTGYIKELEKLNNIALETKNMEIPIYKMSCRK